MDWEGPFRAWIESTKSTGERCQKVESKTWQERILKNKIHVCLVVCKQPFHDETFLRTCQVGSYFDLDHILTMTRPPHLTEFPGPIRHCTGNSNNLVTTGVPRWAQKLWQQRQSLSICIWFHFEKQFVTMSYAPTLPPLSLQLFLDFSDFFVCTIRNCEQGYVIPIRKLVPCRTAGRVTLLAAE